ncbi:hypothetical protein VTO73DRAFT_15584, partial [Trametes versicolor]
GPLPAAGRGDLRVTECEQAHRSPPTRAPPGSSRLVRTARFDARWVVPYWGWVLTAAPSPSSVPRPALPPLLVALPPACGRCPSRIVAAQVEGSPHCPCRGPYCAAELSVPTRRRGGVQARRRSPASSRRMHELEHSQSLLIPRGNSWL